MIDVLAVIIAAPFGVAVIVGLVCWDWRVFWGSLAVLAILALLAFLF